MAIRLPQVERQIGYDTPNLGVTIPDIARPVEGAVGAPQKAMTQGASDILGIVQKRAQEKADLADAQVASQNRMKYAADKQNLLTSQDEEDIMVNGQKVKRPKGILNRQLGYAKGSTEEFDSWYNQNAQNYLAGIRDPKRQMEMMESLQKDYYSTRDSVISHEAKQDTEDKANTFKSSIELQTQQASGISDPNKLNDAILSVSQEMDNLNRTYGYDPKTAELKKQKSIAEVIKASALGSLLNDPTGDTARKLIDSAGNVSNSLKSQLNKNINIAVDKNLRNIEIEKTARVLGTQADYLSKLASGDLKWINSDDVANDVRNGKISERFGLAMIDVLKSEGNYDRLSAQNENYPDFVKSIYEAKDQTELHNALVNILQDHKNMSQEKMAVLINEAVKRGGNLSISNKLAGEKQVDPKQQVLDSGALAVIDFGRKSGLSNTEIADLYKNYSESIDKGKPVQESYDTAIKSHVIKQFPAAATMETPPNMILDENSPIRVIFPRGKKSASSKSDNVSK